jgi:hypothetical protein
MKSDTTKTFDLFGILISILCGIHCIMTPFLIVSMPKLGEGLESPWVHTGLIVLMLLAFHQSVYKHFKIHGSKLTLGLGITGFFFVLISYANELLAHGEEHGHAGEVHNNDTFMIALAVTGGIFLVSSHLINIRKCRCLAAKGTCKDH